MQFSLMAKVLLRAGIVLSIVVYLLVIELGISAGRVHRGVSVAGLDVGGLTQDEARSALRKRVLKLRAEDISFGAEGVEVTLPPSELGWWGGAKHTANLAMEVGRSTAPLRALSERFRAWTDGVEVEWAHGPRPRKVTAAIDRVERIVEGHGMELQRYRFRLRIRRALVTWPRRQLRLPIR